MKLTRAAFWIAVAWLLFVTILLCTPGSKLPRINWDDKLFLDKWAHLFLFLVLVILWCGIFLKSTSGTNIKKAFITITVLSIIYGIGMEIVQHYFIEFRSLAYGDMIANAVGSIAGYFISLDRFQKSSLKK